MKKISIIVPVYNEEKCLDKFYDSLVSELKENKIKYELIFIDDGSRDDSLNIIKAFAKDNKNVIFYSFSRNFGKESAMYCGLSKSVGDYVVIMDADLQDSPDKLIEMYNILINENYDCVALYTKTHKDYGIFRKVFTNWWYKIISKISSLEQVQGARDYRLMTRQMVDAIIELHEYNRYTKGIFGYIGFKTKWIEYEAPGRIAGTSKFNLKKLFKYALEGIVSFSTTPLILAAYVGLFFCFVAFLAIIFIIVKTLIFGDPTSGWPSLACIIIFVSGIQLFFLGIIGLYLSKIYLEVKSRPIYIVKETNKKN